MLPLAPKTPVRSAWPARHARPVPAVQKLVSPGLGAPGVPCLLVSVAFDLCGKQLRGRKSRQATARRSTVVSPFGAPQETKVEEEVAEEKPEDKKKSEEKQKPKLPLTWDNVQEVLDELRPYLKSDGGDCKISDIDGTVVRLELIGACSSCSASSVTMTMGIEKSLKERIPEVSEVVAVTPEQEPLTSAGVEEVLNGIRPFLSVSGGSIEIFELGDGDDPKVVLKMIGPPLKSMAVRVEVQNRIKRKYPAVQEVSIVGEDGQPPSSA